MGCPDCSCPHLKNHSMSLRIIRALGWLGCLLAPLDLLGADYVGFTEPVKLVQISTAELGMLTSVDIREGERVTGGQIIAELDARVLESSLAIAEARANSVAELRAARAMLKLRQTHLEKLLKLETTGHARVEEVARSRTEVEVARAKLLAAREQLKIHELERERIVRQLERRRIRSPVDGVVVKVHKQPSEIVRPNDPVIATLVQIDQLYVMIHVPTADLSSIEAAGDASISFPVTEQRTSGQLDYISPITDADSGTTRVRVLIDNPQGLYRSGVRCVVTL